VLQFVFCLFNNCENIEFNHIYLYDSLGRIKSNVNPLYCYIDDGSSSESSDSKVLTINKYYKNGSNLVSSTVEKLNTFPHNSVAFSNQLVYNEYSYDNLENVTKVNQTGIYFYKNSENKLYNTNLTPYTKEYEYDSFNRLVKEITEVDNENISTIIYKYNDLGYLSKVLKDEALQKEFIYDNGRLVKYNKYGLTYDIMYDNYGNMLTSYNHDYTYNNSNKLSKVYLIDSKKTIENKYNYQGIRCEKIIKDKDGNIENKIKYYLDDKKIHREDRLDRNNNIINTIRYYYDINGICGLRYNNKNYTLIKDELGNISRIMYQGILVAEYRYDAWGDSTIKYYSTDTDEKEAANINPFRYKGYYWDRETNLYYCNYRYYSPEICRWISPDSIEYLDYEGLSGIDLYCYCNNNPVIGYDPDGHFTLLGLIISFVVSVAFEVVEDAMDGELFTDDSHDWKDYLGAGVSGLFGGLGGGLGAQAVFSVAGGFADAAISGDLAENGFWNTMGSIGTSTIASIGVGSLSKYFCSKIKVNSLNKLTNNFANRNLSDMGINVKMGSNIVKNGGWFF